MMMGQLVTIYMFIHSTIIWHVIVCNLWVIINTMHLTCDWHALRLEIALGFALCCYAIAGRKKKINHTKSYVRLVTLLSCVCM